MTLRKRIILLLLVVVATWSVVHALDHGKDAVGDATAVDVDDDDLLQLNPDYEPGMSDHESKTDYSDSEVEEEDKKDREEAKAEVSKALSKSKKGPRRALKLLKKHRTNIMMAMAVYAFRREIWLLMLQVFGTAQADPDTGETFRQIKVQPMTILKIFVFIDLMRRFQSMDSNSSGQSLPLAALLVGGKHGAVLSQVISALLKMNNPTYVPPIEQHYTFERMNERYMKDSMALQKAMQPAKQQTPKKRADSSTSIFGSYSMGAIEPQKNITYNGTVILFDLTGLDVGVSRMSELSDKVSFLLDQHRAKQVNPNKTEATNAANTTSSATETQAELEVVIMLESPGGSAADYGLAAQQILRLRDEPGIKVTVCVDKVAASGGYMMACTSSPGRLYAAPFAVVGSIGVIGQSINVHNALEKWGVKPLVIRGGKHKSPLGMIGEVTEDAIATVQTMVDKTHNAFKRHVLTARPTVAQHLEDVATGEVWLGSDAIDVGLVDRVITSDEYIGERLRDGARVLKLINYDKRKFLFGPDPRTPLAYLTKSVSTRLAEFRRITSKLSHVLNELMAGELDSINIPAACKSVGVPDLRKSGIP